MSYNRHRGTTRGLHYQIAPFQEAKLVRCSRGVIYDVIVDLRVGSPTYLRWSAVSLSARKLTMVYVPEGFAHGFQTLEDDTEVFYQMSERYAPDSTRGARWDDPAFAIDWPAVDRRILSEQDQSWPLFSPLRQGMRSL